MHSVLIIDDEPAIRNTLIKLINCFHNEYRIVGEAVNGSQGFNLILENKPDIIILDIKMPEMDGLALLEKIRKQNIGSKVIILTAYNDFEYARTALKHSVLDYLLKPVKRSDLLKVLNKASLIIKKEQEGMEREISIKKTLDKSAHAYKDTLLSQLVDGENLGRILDDIPSVIPRFKCASVMVFNIWSDPAVKKSRLNEIRQLVETFPNMHIKGHCFTDRDNRLVFIEILEDDSCQDNLSKVITEHAKIIQYMLYNAKGYCISIGIGRTYHEVGELSKSYSEACIALEHRFSFPDKSIISIDDCTNYPAEFKYPSKIENLLLNSLLFGDGDSILINIDLFFEAIIAESLNPAALKQACMQLGMTMLKKIKELNINAQTDIPADSCFYDMSRYETVNEFKNQLTIISYKIIQFINENRKNKNEYKFKKMVDKYLDENYQRNIGLIDIAKELGITPNYFSSLFKKEVGENFVEYLTQYRIEKAKKMLVEDSLNISKIAEIVGFNDARYFFRVFKKNEGITPKEFQQNARFSE